MAVSPGLLFWLFVLCPIWRMSGPLDLSTGQHFGKHKLCIDKECSKKQPETKSEEPASATLLKTAIHTTYSTLLCLTKMLLYATLFHNVHPGPHIYQLPWKPELLTMLLVILLLMIFIGRTILVVKERVYQVTEHQISQHLIKCRKENYHLVQKLLIYKEKIKESKKHTSSLHEEDLKQKLGASMLKRYRPEALTFLDPAGLFCVPPATVLDQKEKELLKKLSQKEYERQEKEQRLSAAEEKVVLAAEEVKTYKRRIKEMEEELQKTERSFKNQIATHEKKAHDNWLKGRDAERAIAEEKMETANLRHKLLEITQKMAMRQDEPGIMKPMPGRPNTQNPPQRGPPSQNGSFGPSPMSGGECSPPLTAEPTGRPLSATFNRSDMPRSEFDLGCGPASMNSSSRSSSPAKVMDDSKQTIPQEPEAPSVPTITSLAEHPVAVNMAKGPPPPFQGVPLIGSPVGQPPPPPIGYGPPFQLGGPFGPRPFPPPPPIPYGPPFQLDEPFGPRPFPPPPPIGYGPPFQLGGPFGPRPFPPPFGPGMRPPLGLREYEPGVPNGKRDLPFDPQES